MKSVINAAQLDASIRFVGVVFESSTNVSFAKEAVKVRNNE